ncbi:MAG: ADP-ribosylglycohydrolase family protein [Lachnospiraceae bacterium]|nr:ADP-ribosylglycohydrolase family protein [Lachnospiraceae bacterium]
MTDKRNIWIDGIMGVVIGDSLGMPVQFWSREEIKEAPVTSMRGYGSYNMPPGTWSDDSSMAIATLDSILENRGIDYDDIMRKFYEWTVYGKYTPAGKAFDQGNTCMAAIINYAMGKDYKSCGKTGERANGNGALMRIMPVCLYSYIQYRNGKLALEEALDYIHQATAITHNHLRAKIASGIYFFMVQTILDSNGSLLERLQEGVKQASDFYKKDIANLVEWTRYGRLENLSEFAEVSDTEIRSTGYVVDTLEAAVWSLITTDSLEEGLLKAVNLGDDTDTVGAVAGGLAGLYYGYESVPGAWKEVIIKGNEIVELCKMAGEEFGALSNLEKKREEYEKLVADVREDYQKREREGLKDDDLRWCDLCEEINLWTYWQGRGNLQAKIVLLGQDWGCAFDKNFEKFKTKIETMNNGESVDYLEGTSFDTDKNLEKLFKVLGYSDLHQNNEDLFFTNLALGYRAKGSTGNTNKKWFEKDAKYLKRLVNILEPDVIICLGKNTYEIATGVLCKEINTLNNFYEALESGKNFSEFELFKSDKKVRIYGVSHCGNYGIRNRAKYATKISDSKNGMELQEKDWERIREYFKK